MMPTAAQSLPSSSPTDILSRTETRWLAFRGTGADMLGLFLVNAILTVLTFGVYYFWAKARVRRFLWGSVELDGERFEFHGTGKELFFGWLRVVGILIGGGAVMGIASAIFGPSSIPVIGMTLLFYAGMLFLIPIAMVLARRYLLTRTSWKGIRFSFRGDPLELARTFVGGALLTMVTLGFYSPYFACDLQRFMTNGSYFGDRQFKFEGHGRDLILPYVKAFFLAFVTFGMSFVWYQATVSRYVHDRTTCGSVRFASTITGGGLLGLAITNMLLVMFTFGLATPWVLVRSLRYICETTAVRGSIDLASVGQNTDTASAMGEELAAVLGV